VQLPYDGLVWVLHKQVLALIQFHAYIDNGLQQRFQVSGPQNINEIPDAVNSGIVQLVHIMVIFCKL
jgi:hypothetical protein